MKSTIKKMMMITAVILPLVLTTACHAGPRRGGSYVSFGWSPPYYRSYRVVRTKPVKAKKPVSAFSQIICILMAIGLCYWSGKVTLQIRHWVMPATEISRAFVYGAAPVGSFFIIIYSIRNFVNDLIVKKPTVIDKKEEAGKMTMKATEEKGLI